MMQTCSQTKWKGDEQYLRWFDQSMAEQRVPLSGSIDLTYRCNLRCAHCYLGELRAPANNTELNTDQWISILDELAEAGCLLLLISGGEPFFRKDFETIYRHAKLKGFIITLFTNATLLTDRMLNLLADLPPLRMEISIYGATADTYERITGVKGSFNRCISGIESLLELGISVSLKTILMTINCHEFFDIKKMADTYDVDFRFDAGIFPCFNGDQTPVHLRVSAKEAIEKEFLEEGLIEKWLSYLKEQPGAVVTDSVYNCGSGLNTFHIDPSGFLKPCLLVKEPRYNLLEGDFMTGWRSTLPRIREKKASGENRCVRCEKIELCNICPAFFELETGSDEIRSEFVCEMADRRDKAIKKYLSKGGPIDIRESKK